MRAIAEQGRAKADEALSAVLRHIFLRAPLFLPLLAVVSILLGAWWYLLAVFALLAAAALRLWRIGVAVILCASLAYLQQERRQRASDELMDYLRSHEVVELQGTVIRELNKGCVLGTEWGGMRVVVRGGDFSWKQGDYVKVVAEKGHSHPPPVLGMFDAVRWMQQQGLAADLRFVRGEYIGHPFSWAAICGAAAAVRDSLARRVMPPGTEDDARRQVLCALVLGDKSRAEDETMLDFRKGGCLHAFAVSGLHVGLLAGILWAILRICRVSMAVSRVVVLLVSALYVVMTGFSVPAIRAFMMMAVVLVGAMLHRRVSLLNTWSFVALLILLPQPYQIYNAGFRLSFVVYAAICVGARLALREKPWFGPDEYIPHRIRTTGERRLSAVELTLRGAILISLWAWLVSLPITIAQFHTLNTHSYLTNILITPILPFVMTAGLAAMILAPLPILGAAVMQWALYSAQALISVVAFCGELPAAYLPAQRPQPAERLAILSTGYGESACQLGNRGLLIAMGNEQTARFSIEPALFHAGYTPAALLLPRPSARRSELATVFGGTWPQLKVLDTTELAGKTTLTTNAGVFTIYAPPATLPRKPMDNATPIVAWQRSKDRVLYVGDASLLTFESIPAEERRADILILGRNKRMPLVDADTIRSIGASCIILLPSAGGGSPDVQSLHPAEVVRVPLAPSIYFCDENVQTSH